MALLNAKDMVPKSVEAPPQVLADIRSQTAPAFNTGAVDGRAQSIKDMQARVAGGNDMTDIKALVAKGRALNGTTQLSSELVARGNDAIGKRKISLSNVGDKYTTTVDGVATDKVFPAAPANNRELIAGVGSSLGPINVAEPVAPTTVSAAAPTAPSWRGPGFRSRKLADTNPSTFSSYLKDPVQPDPLDASLASQTLGQNVFGIRG